jgi:hypothetical protein
VNFTVGSEPVLPDTVTASEIFPDVVAEQAASVELAPDAEVDFGVEVLVAEPPFAQAAREAARPRARTRESAVRVRKGILS